MQPGPTEAVWSNSPFDIGGAAGERKQVTVLFADIVGSTAMIRDLDIEESVGLLDPVVRDMVAAVQAEEGSVLRLQGDGLKAVFGAPLAQEDHAHRACSASLRILNFAQARNIAVRIGLNSGEVVVRSFAVGHETVYDAGGMPVHLAARIEQLASPGTICMSAATARLVRTRFRVRRVGDRQAKGLTESLELFVLMGPRSTRSRWEARAAQWVGKLVGRKAELDRLCRELQMARSGQGTTIAIIGSPGIGKSRLVYELLNSRMLRGWTVVTASTEATDIHTGLRPFANMLRRWIGIGDGASPNQIWKKLQDHVVMLQSFDEHDLDALATLLDLPAKNTTSRVSTPDLRRGIFDAVVKLVRCWATRRATLLIFEDVHWLDHDSKELLRAILQSSRDLPLAIVITCRDGYPGTEFEDLVRTRLELSPLCDIDAISLLDTKLGSHASVRAIKQQIIARAGGIPFFMEEMVQDLIENQAVVKHEADYQAAQKLSKLRMPSTVQSLLADRMDRLPARHRDIIRLASVIGQEVPLQLLARLLSCSVPNLEMELRPIWHSGMLVPADLRGDKGVRFRHVLTQEAAYAGLLKEQRRTLHERILRAYESLYLSRLDEHVEIMSYHAREAALRSDALEYLTRAAQKAIRLSRHSNAIAFLSEALLTMSEATIEDDELELKLRLLLRVAFNAIGNYRERLPNLDRAQALAKKTGNTTMLPEIMISRASVLLQLGKAPEALAICESVYHATIGRDDFATAIVAGYSFSRSLFYNGQVEQALGIATETLFSLGTSQTDYRHGGAFGSSKVMLLTQISQAQACLGQFSDAIASGEQALGIARDGRRNWDVTLASYGLGIAHLYAGDLEVMVPVLEEALRISEADGAADSVFGMLASLLGYAYLRSGQTESALAHCRQALGHHEESFHHSNWTRLCCAAAFAEAGRTEDAMQLAREANSRAKQWHYPVQLVWSNLLLAELLGSAEPAQAARHLSQALRTSQTLQLTPFIERGFLLRSRLASHGARRSRRSGPGPRSGPGADAAAMEA